MTTFIMIPVSDFDVFADRYLEVTKEAIQIYPPVDKDDLLFLVGSSRVNQEHINILSPEFPDVKFSKTIPQEWVPPVREDEI